MKIVKLVKEVCGKLTIGELYSVTKEDSNYYYVADDDGNVDGWLKSRFVVVSNFSLNSSNALTANEIIDTHVNLRNRVQEKKKEMETANAQMYNHPDKVLPAVDAYREAYSCLMEFANAKFVEVE